MKKVTRFFKQLLCDHSNKKEDNVLRHADGRTYYCYQTKCVNCGKVWRING